MPGVMVDTSYPFSDQALQLCRELENDMADVIPLRLWCWGIATERVNGRFSADADQLAQIVRYRGDSTRLMRSLISCKIIEETENKNEFRIKGWDRNARFFKERDRLRRKRRTQNARVQIAGSTQNARKMPEPSSSSSSSSSDLSLRERYTHAAPHPESAYILAARRELSAKHNRKCPERDTKKESWHAHNLLMAYPKRWREILEKYFANDWYEKVGWDLKWLSENAAKVDGRDDGKKPPVNFSEKIAKQEAANRAALEEF